MVTLMHTFSLMLSSGQSHATPVRRKLAVIIFDILSNVFAGLNRPEFFRELNPSAWGRPLAKVSVNDRV